MKYLFAALAPALLAIASPALAAPKQGDVVIRHVTIVDVEAAKTVAGQAVVLKGDDIVAVGADAVIAKDWRAARTVEGKGRYLIPGLWDMHVHFGGGPELIDENRALLPL
ncbi:MAG: amidohydrolase family protein, partial [Sphingopyxis sp.]